MYYITRFLLRRELISTIWKRIKNCIYKYKLYIKFVIFGRCSPDGELYWRDPEPVGDWRGQGASWPQDVVPVNEQNRNSRAPSSRFVDCSRSFYLFILYPRLSSCMNNFANVEHYFSSVSPHENVEFLNFIYHPYISSWNSVAFVTLFSFM